MTHSQRHRRDSVARRADRPVENGWQLVLSAASSPRWLLCALSVGVTTALLVSQVAAQQSAKEQPLDGNAAATPMQSLDALLTGLQAESYFQRKAAKDRLQQWIETQPARQAAAELEQQLGNPRWALDVRHEIEGFLAKLPAPPKAAPVEALTAEQIAAAVAALSAEPTPEAPGIRHVAQWQIERWTQLGPPAICLLVDELRRYLADERLNFDVRRQLDHLHHLARRTWVMSDPAKWKHPEVTREQLAGWVNTLASTENERNASAIRTARRELLDHLMRDELVDDIRSLIEEKLQMGKLSRQAINRLNELKEWCIPSLVAEVWSDRSLVTIQLLQVGVPQHPFGAANVTLFDKVDDKKAHCVSGNSLQPGDYPVMEAIPHPSSPGPMFHLTNTPNPRRQMAYRYRLQSQSEEERLREITARTLTNWIVARKSINERQILLLGALDAKTVSERIGEYFLAVDDRRSEVAAEGFFPEDTRHFAKLCVVLGNIGTREAAAGLLKAIEKERFLPPAVGEERMEWAALLAIAARDPWENLDAWLLEQAASELQLSRYSVEDKSEWDATLGACAAALFLKRRGLEPEEHGLRALVFRRAVNYVPWYRFNKPADRERFLQVWTRTPLGERGAGGRAEVPVP